MNCSFNHYQILQKEIPISTKLLNNFPNLKVFGTKPYGDELNSITSVTVVRWLECRTSKLGVPGLICISVSSCLLYLLHNNGKIIVPFLPSFGPYPS